MTRSNRPDSDAPNDIRLKATGLIWGPATGMLGICIPLVAIGGSEAIVLPALVLIGATISTLAIWLSSGGNRSEAALPAASRLRQIEERLSNLETITTGTDVNLQARFKQLESTDRER